MSAVLKSSLLSSSRITTIGTLPIPKSETNLAPSGEVDSAIFFSTSGRPLQYSRRRALASSAPTTALTTIANSLRFRQSGAYHPPPCTDTAQATRVQSTRRTAHAKDRYSVRILITSALLVASRISRRFSELLNRRLISAKNCRCGPVTSSGERVIMKIRQGS